MLKVLNSDIKYQEIVDFIPSSPNQDVMNSASFTDTNTRLFVNFGIGYEFNKKYSINLQYTPSQDYLNRSAFTGGISSFSVFFAYTLNK
jgi:hypothetical protein